MSNQEHSIRFIDSEYNEKFRISDGDRILIHTRDGGTMERECRYIDDYHTKIGLNIYHICEFAELCEKNGHTVGTAEKEKDFQWRRVFTPGHRSRIIKRPTRAMKQEGDRRRSHD